jgi:lipid II:glycine glycyltransferase (peptidoglycan interpeptide bridge formation enzyme)
MTNKEKYRIFCTEDTDMPVFSKDWWLDATCGENNWDVAIIEKNNKIVASFPYSKSKVLGVFTKLGKPALSQKLGPYIKYPDNQKYTTKLGYEKELFTELIEQLPKFDYFLQGFDHSITNILPFHWKKFDHTLNYTYIIENIDQKSEDQIFEDFKTNVRNDIRKAQKSLTVSETNDIELFYSMNKKIFESKNMKIPYSFEFMKRIDNACSSNNCKKIFIAKDEQNIVCSVIYIIWDKNAAYYIAGGSNPEVKNQGANTLVIWEAIRSIRNLTHNFDFEGSMIQPIEHFFGSFGSKQTPYFKVRKFNSIFLRIIFGIKFLKSGKI